MPYPNQDMSDPQSIVRGNICKYCDKKLVYKRLIEENEKKLKTKDSKSQAQAFKLESTKELFEQRLVHLAEAREKVKAQKEAS